MPMTTASDDLGLREGGQAVEPAALPESLPGQARTCATSLPLPSTASPVPVTERVRAAGAAAARYAVKTTEYLDRPASLVHHHPPTFARARERHHEAARRHTTVPLFAGLRLTWGYLHLLLIKPALNLLEWVTETPLRLSAVVILCVIIWIGS